MNNPQSCAIITLELYGKLAAYYHCWNSLSKSVAFSQFFFKISLCKIHSSPSHMVVATIDFIYNCAWMQLSASADFRNDEISEISEAVVGS